MEEKEIITLTASTCSIKIFMLCLFEGKHNLVGGSNAWDLLYTDYIDLSGAADTKECTLLRNIHNKHSRIFFINYLIQLQLDWHREFGVPFPEAFKDFKRFGHRLIWNDDWEFFEKQLKRIEAKEKKNVAELDGLKKELERLRKHGMKAADVKPSDRRDFIKLIQAVEESRGFALNKEETTVEEFAIMVKSRKDIADAKN